MWRLNIRADHGVLRSAEVPEMKAAMGRGARDGRHCLVCYGEEDGKEVSARW